MKIKILPMLVIISLFLTGINVIAIENNVENITIQIAKENDFSLFSNAKIKQKGEYFEVNVEEANTVLRATGKPVLPCNTKIYTFPRGTKIKDVKCTISEVRTTTKVITGKIQPAPEPVKRVSIQKNVEIADNILKTKNKGTVVFPACLATVLAEEQRLRRAAREGAGELLELRGGGLQCCGGGAVVQSAW